MANTAASARQVSSVSIEVRTPEVYDKILPTLAAQGRVGVIQLGSPGFSVLAPRFAAATIANRLPNMTFLGIYARLGALMSYGPRQETYYARAVPIAHQILMGVPASEIPIESAAEFEFVVNLKTAAAMDLAIPTGLLARADEIID